MKLPYPVVKAILEMTHFEPRVHDLTGSYAEDLLRAQGLDPTFVRISINRDINLRLTGFPPKYSEVTVDIGDYHHGAPNCSHKMIELRWEEGGGGMDSGTPYRYSMCFLCGYHEKSRFEQLGSYILAALHRRLKG